MLNFRRVSAVLPVMFAVALSTCGKKSIPASAHIQQKKEVKDPEKISDSFSVPKVEGQANVENGSKAIEPSSALRVELSKLTIRKNALEKEFLIQGSKADQAYIALGQSLKSRVVTFRKLDGRIFMMESTQGHSVSSELPQNLILASFPILSETENEITFDFNAGMSKLFVTADWKARDYDGPEYQPEYDAMRIQDSYIASSQVTGNHVEIRQVAQVDAPKGELSNNATVEVKYFISPYQPSPDFKPFPTYDLKRMGFFEVSPLAQASGNDIMYASRFNEKKPIVFAISENTPKEFQEAIKDGILYWNKAYGEERVKVIVAPKGITAPDLNYNVVQWVTWDQAGYAYADAQMDPRSGEILHAQVYLTSSWAIYGKETLRTTLRKLKEQKNSYSKRHRHVALAGFSKPEMCDLTEGVEMRSLDVFDTLLAENASDEHILQAAQDMVRNVVAHEIGHTLGLRHNFAASTAVNYPISERDTHIKNYLKTGKASNEIVVASSVMDYLESADRLLSGSQIGQKQVIREYDKKAIETLYGIAQYKASELPTFCTDSDVSSYADCKRFDFGKNPVESAAWSRKHELENMANGIVNRYIAMKTEPLALGLPELPLTEVDQDAAVFAKEITSHLRKMFKLFGTEGELKTIHFSFPSVTSLNASKVIASQNEAVKKSIAAMGGWNAFWGEIPTDFKEKTLAKLDALLANDKLMVGIGFGEKTYAFTEADKALIRSNTVTMLNRLPTEMLLQELSILNGELTAGEKSAAQMGQGSGEPMTLRNNALTAELLTQLKETASKVMFATSGEPLVREVELPAAVDGQGAATIMKVNILLPQFKYPLKARIKAASLINLNRIAGNSRLGYNEWLELTKAHTSTLKFALGGINPSTLIIDEMPEDVAFWLKDYNKIYETLYMNGY